MWVCRSLIATPMLPKRRPSPPSRSKKPRCNRAGLATVTLTGFRAAALCKRRLPRFLSGARFFPIEWVYTALSKRDWQPQPTRGGRIMAESKERTYSDDEIQSRLKKDLPHWYLENGWIRRKYKTHSWKGT